MKPRLKVGALALAVALACGVGVHSAPATASGIPVIDVAAIAEAIRQYQQLAEQLKTMQSQLQTAKDQLKEAQQLYNSMTGDRGMQNIGAGENRNVIPSNWQETLAQMQGGGQISGLAQQIKDASRGIDLQTLNRLLPASALDASERSMNGAAAAQAAAGTVYDNSANRFGRLQALMDAIPTATDAKAIADLQARIQVEQVMLQNESIQMQAMLQAQAAQRDLDRQRIQQETMDRSAGSTRLRTVVR